MELVLNLRNIETKLQNLFRICFQSIKLSLQVIIPSFLGTGGASDEDEDEEEDLRLILKTRQVSFFTTDRLMYHHVLPFFL